MQETREGIARWLAASDQQLRLDIDRFSCVLSKQHGGVGCAFEFGMSLHEASFNPRLLLQLASAGLGRFIGALALNPDDGQCVLVKWVACHGESAQQDSADVLGVVEQLANQAEVWNDMLISHQSRHRNRRNQSVVPRSSSVLPLSLSQQLRGFR